MAGVVIWCPFFIFFSRFLHALAGSGHPLGGLADVTDGNGWFSLAHKGKGQHPSYIKTQYKPNLSQLGPWPLKGHLSMRALAVGRCEQLGLPSGVLVLGVRGGQGPSGLPLGVQWGPLGGRQGDITLAVRRHPPPRGLTRHAKFRRPCDGPNGAAGYPAPALIPPAPPWDRGRPAGGRGVGPWYSNGDVRAPTSKIA